MGLQVATAGENWKPRPEGPEGPGWQGHTEKNLDTRTDHDKNKRNVCLSVKASKSKGN